MSHLQRLGSQFAIDIPPDEKGYIGRECPACEKYFKITLGTGLKGTGLPCHCPYCGHSAPQDQFFTKAQLEYAKSVVLNQVTGAFLKDLKALEFNHRPKGMFGIGISMKVEGRPQPVRHYSEHDLEEEVLCDGCSLKYTVYGSFAYCPDCGMHNSLQILEKNIRVADKLIDLAKDQEPELRSQLVSDALENGVSAFDGFGRETCQVFSGQANDPAKAKALSFQNLPGAQKNVQQLFGIDLTGGLSASEWLSLNISFQKRHLIAHKMGIVDEAYLRATGDTNAVSGRKVKLDSNQIREALELLLKLGTYLTRELRNLP